MSVGRSELVAVLGPDCPVESRKRFFDRRRNQIGDRQIPIFRQDLGEVGERFAQLIELIGGVGPVLIAPGETELDMARLHERGHQIAKGGSVLCVSWACHSECCYHRNRRDRLMRFVHGL